MGWGHSGTWYIDGNFYYGNNSFEYHDTGVIIPIDPTYDGDAVGFDFYHSCDLVGTANY
ncbi:MAG: hypothetical protein NKF70_11320 [Methanobacterium sp. ERen5]|nr:MAG: hypothetical protein NKF70_11320 [Methanobacterium sp. ERen5]